MQFLQDVAIKLLITYNVAVRLEGLPTPSLWWQFEDRISLYSQHLRLQDYPTGGVQSEVDQCAQ